MSDLWTEASVDVEAEHIALRHTRAKVAVASLWPYLAMAASLREFEHRLAVADPHIAERIDADLYDGVVASLREDFRLIAQNDNDADDDDSDSTDDSQSDDDGDGDGKPDWLQKKIDSTGARHGAMAYQPLMQAVAYYDAQQGWVKVALDDDANAGAGNPWYFTGGPEGGPMTGDTSQYPTFPVGNPGDPVSPVQGMFPMQPSPWTVPPGGEWRESPMNFSPPGGGYHVGGAQRTATEGIVPTPGPNPSYFAGGPEGSAGEPGGFPPDLTLPEDTENLLNDGIYGNPTPEMSHGTASRRTATDIGEVNRAPNSDPNLGTEFNSPQEAERYQRAWAGEKPGDRDSTAMTGVRRHAFFDPSDRGVRMVAVGEDAPGPGDDAVGGQPQTPPSMTPGGPGAVAGGPMSAGPTSTPGGAPVTTSPRQMPGGGGGDMGADNPFMALRRIAEGESKMRPTSENPYGTADPFDATTWENAANQRPRMPMNEMRFNGPQNPGARERIRTTTSEPGAQQEREQEDED